MSRERRKKVKESQTGLKFLLSRLLFSPDLALGAGSLGAAALEVGGVASSLWGLTGNLQPLGWAREGGHGHFMAARKRRFRMDAA